MENTLIRHVTLYIFAGLPGSGKTTLAQRLAQWLRCTYLRIDTVEQAGDTPRALTLAIDNGVFKPPRRRAADLREHRWLDVDHAISPSIARLGVPRMQLVRVHQHDRVRRRQMLGPRIAKTLDPSLNGTQAVAFVEVRLERVMHDMRAIKLHPRPPGGMAKLGDVRRMLKSIGCTLHGDGVVKTGEGRRRDTARAIMFAIRSLHSGTVASRAEMLAPDDVPVTRRFELPRNDKNTRQPGESRGPVPWTLRHPKRTSS